VRYATEGVPTKYQYTGQYSYEAEFGLYFYNARWYDPYLNHFTQPDSIIPDPYNPQDWNRYSYVRNNPLRYTDPTGHSTCSTVSNQYAKGKCEDWSPENEDYDPCAFNAWDCSGSIDWSNGTQRISRPIVGIHLGGSGNIGVAVENYGYFQGDLLFDASSGAFYGMTTTGSGGYIGTPSGVGGELYVGISNVHGIPGNLNPEEVADLLAGPNVDIAVEVGADAGVEVGASTGVSLDINPVTGGFPETTAGQMYTAEKSAIAGAGLIPTALDAGLEGGSSYSHAYFIGRIPWWPALLP
jgi:RHS repeat-associated protein